MYQTITKTIVAWVFNNYVAYYFFDNININQLKFAFNDGYVELKDLPIKQDALQHLKLPWKVMSGTVGRLAIKIPLLSLLKEPWDITISNLTLVISPVDKSKLKTILESEHLDEPSLPDEFISSAEETKLAEFYKSFSTSVSSMVKDVFKNIRLEINTIHVALKDSSLARFEADKISLERQNDDRLLQIINSSISLRELRPLKFNFRSCDLKIRDTDSSYEIISEFKIFGYLFVESPVANFLLEDFRLLFYTSDQQQDGSIFARLSCCHFNRDNSSWDSFLEPWPFNLSWDKRADYTRFSLTSDEIANFAINPAFLDLIDVIIKRVASPRLPAIFKTSSINHVSTNVPREHCKLTYYNYNTNLAKHIGGRFDLARKNTDFDISFVGPGFEITLLDIIEEKFIGISLQEIDICITTKSKDQIVDCSIQDVRIANLLPNCERNVVLDRANTSIEDGPAFRLIMDRIRGRSFGMAWFRQVQVSMCELCLNVEEKLFIKLLEFIRSRRRRAKREVNHQQDRISKYYFDLLRIDLSGLILSVYTAEIKRMSGLNFFGFEDARVQLTPYFKMNQTRTLGGIFDSIKRFYRQQISEQAPSIVGQQIHNYLRFHLSDVLSYLYEEVYNKLFY